MLPQKQASFLNAKKVNIFEKRFINQSTFFDNYVLTVSILEGALLFCTEDLIKEDDFGSSLSSTFK